MEEKYWNLEDSASTSVVDVRVIKDSYGNAFCMRLAGIMFGAGSHESPLTQRSCTRDIIQFLEWAANHARRFPEDKVSRAVSALGTGRQLSDASEWVDVIKLYMNHMEHWSAPSQSLKISRIWRCLIRLGLVDDPGKKARALASLSRVQRR